MHHTIDEAQRLPFSLGSAWRLRSPCAPPPTSNDSRLKAYSTTPWRRTSSLSSTPSVIPRAAQIQRGPACFCLQAARRRRSIGRTDAHVQRQQAKSLLHDAVATNFQFVEHPRVIPRASQKSRSPASSIPARLNAATSIAVRPVGHIKRQQAESLLHAVATSVAVRTVWPAGISASSLQGRPGYADVACWMGGGCAVRELGLCHPPGAGATRSPSPLGRDHHFQSSFPLGGGSLPGAWGLLISFPSQTEPLLGW